jgi:hypothetical protein
MSTRVIIALLFLSVFAPPVGITALVIYILVAYSTKDGGIESRVRMAMWSRQEPWWTGDPATDEAELDRRVAIMEENRRG